MKKSWKSIIALVLICFISGAALAGVNYFTAPLIEENENSQANDALKQIFPNVDSDDFELLNILEYENIPETVIEAYKAADAGYVVKLETTGYQSGFVILCGVSAEGKVVKAICLSSNETLGKEKTYGEALSGKTLEDIDTADTVSGATVTTTAYKNAVKDALGTVVILLGGSFDNRSEEEIRLDAALPSAEGNFTAWFMTEALVGIDEVFVADNATGYVFVIGDEYIGVGADGNPTAATDKDVSAAFSTVKNATYEQIDLSAFSNIPSAVKAAYKTTSGNYIFDLAAQGYGIKGDYHASGKPISIKVCIGADGKIIDCLTVEQYETEGVGSVCGEKEFYKGYVGLDKTGAQGVDTVAQATITTDGYRKAVIRAFEAFAIIEGGE